ncbi:MAG: folate-binding protein [Pseudomonadota bacterium]
MTGIQATVFDRRAVVSVTGPEARSFLNGLVTVETDHLTPGMARHGALLTPQGKVLFDFFLVATEDGFLLDTPADSASDLIKRLTFYKLRSKVDLAILPDHAIAALWGNDVTDTAGTFADPRLAALGSRIVASTEEIEIALDAAGADRVAEETYDAHRIALGVAEAGQDFAYGDVFPHDIGLDQLSGVDFDKGCYVGQEVVSRMQHRGTARRRFVIVSAGSPLPVPGTDITASGKTSGTLGSVSGAQALALVRLDRIADAVAAAAPVLAGETPVQLNIPAWAGFGWPVSEAAAE